MSGPAVSVKDLKVELDNGQDVVDGITFEVGPGEILGVVGESGSGKTTVGTALLGHTRSGAGITGGSIEVGETDILNLDPGKLTSVRGRVVAYVPQDPAAALNPALRIGSQLREVMNIHGAFKGEREERIERILADVRLPSDRDFLRRYPHELSGGQQQRVAIAMAFMLQPTAIVLDEPTTGLDVTTQAHVLETVRRLCAEHQVAAIYITHDLAVVSDLAHRVMVMYAGRIIEIGSREQVLFHPRHPYTQLLLRAIPSVTERTRLNLMPGTAPPPGHRPGGCSFRPRCPLATVECGQVDPPLETLEAIHSAACLRLSETESGSHQASSLPDLVSPQGREPLVSLDSIGFAYGTNQVLRGVSLDIHPAECVAIVGESGSGKTTLSRVIAGLLAPGAGRVTFLGKDLPRSTRERSPELLRSIQYVFQNPYGSLNPRKSVGEILARPISQFGIEGDPKSLVDKALEEVGLSADMADSFPQDLSGGERQRVAIARALVGRPKLLICDEVTSALDVSAQAGIVSLLRQLVDVSGLAILFVTHDLALVRSVADRCAVLERGSMVEAGTSSTVIDAPLHDYTRELIADTPVVAR